MVFQQVPWLKPTAGTKMYNAEMVRQGIGGKLVDFALQADRGNGSNNERHFELVQNVLDQIAEEGEFQYKDPNTGTSSSFRARYGIVAASAVRDAVAGFAWAPNWTFIPILDFVDSIISSGQLQDFAVILPGLVGAVAKPIGVRPEEFPILRRRRRTDRYGFSGSSKRQRDAIETIAGKRDLTQFPEVLDDAGGELAVNLHTPTRGALLLTFALDNGTDDALPSDLPSGPVAAKDIATLFSWALPYDAAPNGRIGFRTKKSGGAIVDRDPS